MRALLAAALASQVTVRILEARHPQRVEMGGHQVLLSDPGLLVDGTLQRRFQSGTGSWTVRMDGLERIYRGRLSVRPDPFHRELLLELEAPLESYVAGVVAAESDPGTPRAALEALAVVARSYALAPRSETLSDLAGSQVFQGETSGEHGEEARAAAEATAGQVLRLPDGTIAQAVFHSACGGHTDDPREVFGGEERTGARAVADLDPPVTWSARLSAADWTDTLRRLFHDPFLLEEPVLLRGAGDRVVQLALSDGRKVAGDALARALDRREGRGVVKSARFELRREEGQVILTGSGHGHGVGLCQAGAALRAARGDDCRAILAAYFPAAKL